MFDQQVVVRLRDGSSVKGSGEMFFPGDESFDLLDREGHLCTVRVDDVLAVFFVRDLDGDPKRHRPSRPTRVLHPTYGRTVDVHLVTGETIRGKLTGEPRPGERGFFLHPLDPGGNNRNIFVHRDSVVRLQPVEDSEERPSGRFVHPALRG